MTYDELKPIPGMKGSAAALAKEAESTGQRAAEGAAFASGMGHGLKALAPIALIKDASVRVAAVAASFDGAFERLMSSVRLGQSAGEGAPRVNTSPAARPDRP